MKSNSLDKELKQKESELLENQVQRTNFELVSDCFFFLSVYVDH